ncbi:MAG TPA: hypothetical protein VN516_04880 [Candidatus Baltobacteraceae bacterium]|nr:hypothetical protein [Candidatus Baltobacteraceae bacterium]
MNPKLKLSKLDCARRQLELAIELFFMERDPVSIHTLAGATYQLLADINKHRGGKPLTTELEGLKRFVIPGKEKELAKLFKEAENFFKHADRDPEGVIDFSPEINELLLWEASLKYSELTSEETSAMVAIQLWFQVKHPEYFKLEASKQNKFKQSALWAKSVGKKQFYREILAASLLQGVK